jgi:hypothetical protein
MHTLLFSKENERNANCTASPQSLLTQASSTKRYVIHQPLTMITAARRSLRLTDEDEEELSTDTEREGVGAKETFSSTEDS